MMKSKIIGMVVGLLVVIGLVGAMWYISSLEDLPQEPIPDTQIDNTHKDEKNVIFSCDIAELDSLNIRNEHSEYSVRRKGDGTVYIVGKENAPLFPYSSAALFESVKKITCTLNIENGTSNLASYGLDKPSATVKVNLKDGSTTLFHIGNPEPTATGYYICMDGSSDVYLISTFYAERFLNDPINLYDKGISEFFSTREFESLSIDYPEDDDIFIRATNDIENTLIQFITGYAIETPFYFSADSDTMQTVLDSIGSLEAARVASDTVDADTLSSYGFDSAVKVVLKANVNTTSPTLESGLENPFYKATMDGSPYPITLTYLVGGSSEQETYVMYNDAQVIYAVDKSAFEFVQFPLYQYCQKLVSIEYITNLESLKVEFDGKEYLFAVTDPDAGEDMVVTYGEEYLDQDLFRSFYKSIISVTHNGIEPRPNTEPAMRITYGLIKGDDIILEFLPIEDSDRKVFISVNGEGQFVCYRTKVDKIKNDLQKLLNGEEIIG